MKEFQRNRLNSILILVCAMTITACFHEEGSDDDNTSAEETCVDKGELTMDMPVNDNALTDLRGHCYTVALTAGVHYTFNLSVATPLGSSLGLNHDGTGDSFAGITAAQGSPESLIVNLPESRNYQVKIDGDDYTVSVTQAGAPDTTNATTITSVTGPASVTNGQPLDLNVEFLLDNASTQATVGFYSGKALQLDSVVDAAFANVEVLVGDGLAAPSGPLAGSARFETRGDPLATAGTITFPELFASGSSLGTHSIYTLDWPSSAYTGYMLRQTGGNATTYYGTDTLNPYSVTLNNSPSPISCAPPTLSGALSVPTSFVIGDAFDVIVPIAVSGGTADITVEVAGAEIGDSAFGSVSSVSTGSQTVNVDTNAIAMGVGNNLISVSLSLNAQTDCKSTYAGAVSGNYMESQHDATSGERYLIETSVPVSTVTALEP